MAEAAQIAEAVERLAVHCRTPVMSLEERSVWLEDWCRDFAEFPIEAITEACRRWRNGEDRRFPLPGQLRPLVVLAVAGGDRPVVERAEPWRPVSQAEYQAMTVAEKLRHQRILCSNALRKAGPMWRNGRPVTADELPDTWRRWRDKAAGHEAEALRLAAHLERSGEPA